MSETSPQLGLRFGPLSANTLHVCVDMQRLFGEDTPWRTPWMERVLPRVTKLVDGHASQTIFTRFIPAAHPGMGRGAWARYWTRWADMTLERLPSGMIELMPQLAGFTPPASVVDKTVNSPWLDGALQNDLDRRGADTLIVTGCETDVCVLATVLGSIDRGYRTIVVTDALCSSSDETHDASIKLYAQRYSQQVETIDTATLLSIWR